MLFTISRSCQQEDMILNSHRKQISKIINDFNRTSKLPYIPQLECIITLVIKTKYSEDYYFDECSLK